MSDAGKRGRHRAARPARRGRSLRIRSLAGGSLTVAGAMAVAVVLSGGTSALWAASNPLSGGVVTAGNASLRLTQSFDPALWSRLLAGESVRQQFSLANDGLVPLALSAAGATESSSYELRVANGACPPEAMAGESITVEPASLGVLEAGATARMCLEVRLGSSATAGSSSSVSVTVTGSQS